MLPFSDNPVVFFMRLLHQDHDFIVRHVRRLIPISTHIPRVGDDQDYMIQTLHMALFQSTSPVWGMTHGDRRSVCREDISIHITRVGDDCNTA